MKLRQVTFAVLVGLLAAQAALGDASWTGGGTSTDWSDTANWSGGVLPAAYPSAAVNVVFGTGSAANMNVNALYAQADLLSFTAPNDFTLSATAGLSQNWGTLHVNGITVAPSDGLAHSYTVNAQNVIFNQMNTPISVAAGCTLGLQQNLPGSFGWDMVNQRDPHQLTPGITKTGAGTLFIKGAAGTDYTIGTLDIQQGSMVSGIAGVGGGQLWVRGGLHVADGASLLVTSGTGAYLGTLMLGAFGAPIGDSVIEGSVTVKAFAMYGGGTLTIRGTNGKLSTGGFGTLDGNMGDAGDASLILDKRADISLATRNMMSLAGNTQRTPHVLQVYGNDTTDSIEASMGSLVLYKGLVTVEPIHGTNASLTLAFTRAGMADNKGGAQLLIKADNLTTDGTTHTDTPHTSILTNANGLMITGTSGSGDLRIAPNAFVGMEFATLRTSTTFKNMVMAFSGSGRTTLAGSSQSYDNVLVSDNTDGNAMTFQKTINSLKVNGATDLNLNGWSLLIGPTGSNLGNGYGAGIIWTNTLGSAGTIRNGWLQAGNNLDNAVFIRNDVDLTLASDVTVAGILVSKSGTGKLTVQAAMPNKFTWLGGTLDWETNSDVTVVGYLDAVEDAASQLIKGGNGTMTLGPGGPDSQANPPVATLRNRTGGGVLIKSGTLATSMLNLRQNQTSGNELFGTGEITVNGGASFLLNWGWVRNKVNLHDGSYMKVAGITTGDFGGGVSQMEQGQLTSNSTLNLVDGTATVSINNEDLVYDVSTKNIGGLLGSGTLRKIGPYGGFRATGATAASTGFTGTFLVEEGWLMNPDTTTLSHPAADDLLPPNGKILLGSQGYLVIAASSTLTGHTFAGTGMVLADPSKPAQYTVGIPELTPYMPDGINKITSSGGVWMPGDSVLGDLTVRGDLEFALNGPTAARLVIKASGTTAGSFDRLLVTSGTVCGNLTGLNNAVLEVRATQTGASDWNRFANGSMQVVSCVNDLTGMTFQSIAWSNEMRGVVTAGPGGVTLWNLHNTHQPGDGNGDLKVDIADYTLYFNNYGDKGAANAWYPGDFTGDGRVDIADYTAYFNNYGDHSAGHSAVPEPATMALLALGGLAILRRRK